MKRNTEQLIRQPQTSSHDAVLGLKRAELLPVVQTYIENLEKQIRVIYDKYSRLYDFKDISDFISLARQPQSPVIDDDINEFYRLLKLFERAVQTNEVVEVREANPHIIRVESRKKDIINPFAEVLAENGVSGKETLDTLEIDLGEILESCKETYRAKGLDTWVDALPTNASDIISSDSKQQERFKDYLKEGRIPVFMPSASVQLATMKSMLQVVNNQTRFIHFKPVVFKDGAQTLSSDGIVRWDRFKNLMESKDQSLVTGVPDTCYIMWVKPTQKPERTLENLAEQKKYIQDEQAKFKKEYKVTQPLIYGMMPAEYLALQIAFSALAQEHVQKGGVSIQILNPLDIGTYTRFPGVKEADGLVADAKWNPGDSQLVLDGFGVGANSNVGVRLPVREVKITP